MNKLLKALAKIKSQPNPQIQKDINFSLNEIQDCKDNILYFKRKIIEFKETIAAKEKLLKHTKALSDKDLADLQSEINKIYTLPIKDCKIVRTESKTGYLPKLLIVTGMIELEPITQTSNYDHDFFDQFVGKTLGRFLIQYDWSPKTRGATISMVNLTQKTASYQAPTISSGIPCLGNIDSTVRDLFEKKQFFSLTETLIDYLGNTLYGTPYLNWQDWFNKSKQTTWEDVKTIIFKDYPSYYSASEAKVIESMIPPKELAILKRDTKYDPTYPYLNFMGQSTHDDCHCNHCVKLRQVHNEFQEFLKVKGLSI